MELDVYLLALYVTLEQDRAISQLFADKGWQLKKKEALSWKNGDEIKTAENCFKLTNIPRDPCEIPESIHPESGKILEDIRRKQSVDRTQAFSETYSKADFDKIPKNDIVTPQILIDIDYDAPKKHIEHASKQIENDYNLNVTIKENKTASAPSKSIDKRTVSLEIKNDETITAEKKSGENVLDDKAHIRGENKADGTMILNESISEEKIQNRKLDVARKRGKTRILNQINNETRDKTQPQDFLEEEEKKISEVDKKIKVTKLKLQKGNKIEEKIKALKWKMKTVPGSINKKTKILKFPSSLDTNKQTLIKARKLKDKGKISNFISKNTTTKELESGKYENTCMSNSKNQVKNVRKTAKHVDDVLLSILPDMEKEDLKFPLSLKCPHCKRVFQHKSPFIKHVVRHNKKDFDCHACGKSFADLRNLKSHQFSRTGKKSFPCEFCDFESKAYCLLRLHKKESHKAEEIFQCHLCAKIVKTKSYFNIHLRDAHQIHAGDLECNICGKILLRPKLFAKHMEEHEKCNNKLEKTCTLCGKVYPTKRHLRSHMRYHKERHFLCDNCGKGFPTKTKLHAHERTHTGDKPFKCDQCDYRSTQKGNVQLHSKVHDKVDDIVEPKVENVPVKKKVRPQNKKTYGWSRETFTGHGNNRRGYNANSVKAGQIKSEVEQITGINVYNDVGVSVSDNAGQVDEQSKALYQSMTEASKILPDYYKYLCSDEAINETVAREGFPIPDDKTEFKAQNQNFTQMLPKNVEMHVGYKVSKSHKEQTNTYHPILKVPDAQGHSVHMPDNQTNNVNSKTHTNNKPERSIPNQNMTTPFAVQSCQTMTVASQTNSKDMFSGIEQNIFTDTSNLYSASEIKSSLEPKSMSSFTQLNYSQQNRTMFPETNCLPYSNQADPTLSNNQVFCKSTATYAEPDVPLYMDTLGSIDYSETIQSVYDSSRLMYAEDKMEDSSWKDKNPVEGGNIDINLIDTVGSSLTNLDQPHSSYMHSQGAYQYTAGPIPGTSCTLTAFEQTSKPTSTLTPLTNQVHPNLTAEQMIKAYHQSDKASYMQGVVGSDNGMLITGQQGYIDPHNVPPVYPIQPTEAHIAQQIKSIFQ